MQQPTDPTFDKLSQLYTYAEVERRKVAFLAGALAQALQFLEQVNPDNLKQAAEAVGADIIALREKNQNLYDQIPPQMPAPIPTPEPEPVPESEPVPVYDLSESVYENTPDLS